jgi:hypothetical protein
VVKETIEEGAYVQLTVKYGLIRLITTKADLCKEIGNVDLECPLEAGEMEITKSVDLPAEIPPVRTPLHTHKSGMLTVSRANTPYWPMSTPRTTFRSPALLRQSLSAAHSSITSYKC